MLLPPEVSHCIAERGNAIEGCASDRFREYHGVDRVAACAEVVDESEFVRAFTFRDRENGH